MEIEDGVETGEGQDSLENPGKDQLGRGGAVPPSSDVDLKLAVGAYSFRPFGGPDEPSADVDVPDTDMPDVEEKGLKRKKHWRARPNKKAWLRRKDKEADEKLSPKLRLRSSAFVHSQPAPNNTTQFIMEDHTDLQSLDAHITAREAGSRTTRARDSSFSIDSDEELTSSPEAYLSKEFSNTYEDVHVERLGTMSKVDLIQEYLQLEQKVDTLEKKLKLCQNTSSGTVDSGGNGGTGTDSDSEIAEGEMPMEPAMAEKIRIFQEEIQKLAYENQHLIEENQRLQSSGSLVRPSSSLSSSIDSESDSSTSSGSSSSSSSGSCRSDLGRSSPSSIPIMSGDDVSLDKNCLDNKNSDIEMQTLEQRQQ